MLRPSIVARFERCIGVRSTETNTRVLYHVCTLKGICLFSSWRSTRPAKVFSQCSRIGGPNSWPIAESRARSPNIPAFQTSNAPYSPSDRLVNRTSVNSKTGPKPCRGRPFGLQAESNRRIKTEIPVKSYGVSVRLRMACSTISYARGLIALTPRYG
jgi:hypothetical protein